MKFWQAAHKGRQFFSRRYGARAVLNPWGDEGVLRHTLTAAAFRATSVAQAAAPCRVLQGDRLPPAMFGLLEEQEHRGRGQQ